MPPLVLWAVGAVGAAVAGALIARETKRVGAELDLSRPGTRDGDIPTLRRDPRTGVYRPEGDRRTGAG